MGAGSQGAGLKRMLAVSLLVHCLLLLVVSLLWGRETLPREFNVQLKIEPRPVASEVVSEIIRQEETREVRTERPSPEKPSAARAQREEDLESLLARSSFPHQTRAQPERTFVEEGLDYGRLSRELEALPDPRLSQPDRQELVSGSTQAGLKDRGGAIREDRPSEQIAYSKESGQTKQVEAAQAPGVRDLIELRGRALVYRPLITLPERFSHQGLSYQVEVEIRVSEEGLVLRAGVGFSSGDSELDLLLERGARGYRFESAPGSGNQTGTIRFSIEPR